MTKMNDISKAIGYLKEPIGKSLDEHAEAIESAIEALENQIYKQPNIEPFADIMRMQTCYKVKCPKCGERFFALEFINDKDRKFTEFGEWLKNCYNCGQSLDWGVGE